jgi:methyltransferase (TIGR00027 family)
MFAFKEPVLRGLGAVPRCRRSIVPADLREDWSAPLPGLGFRETVPTAWEAGVLGFLARADAQRLVTALTELSAPGSRLTCPQMSAAAVADTVRSVRGVERVRDAGTPAERGLGPDAPQWLRALGWHTEVRDFGELARAYGRPQPDGVDAGVIVATLA